MKIYLQLWLINRIMRIWRVYYFGQVYQRNLAIKYKKITVELNVPIVLQELKRVVVIRVMLWLRVVKNLELVVPQNTHVTPEYVFKMHKDHSALFLTVKLNAQHQPLYQNVLIVIQVLLVNVRLHKISVTVLLTMFVQKALLLVVHQDLTIYFYRGDNDNNFKVYEFSYFICFVHL